jgi:hypothetical protein
MADTHLCPMRFRDGSVGQSGWHLVLVQQFSFWWLCTSDCAGPSIAIVPMIMRRLWDAALYRTSKAQPASFGGPVLYEP